MELTTPTLVVMAALAELASLNRAWETELGITGWGGVLCRRIGVVGRRTGAEVVVGLIFTVAELFAMGVAVGGEATDRVGAGDVSRDTEVLLTVLMPTVAGLGGLSSEPEVSRLVPDVGEAGTARETGTRMWRGVLPPLFGAASMV